MSFLEICLYISLPLIIISALITLVRLLLGPDIADRVVALDTLTSMSIAFMAAFAVYMQATMSLDVSLILALISFLGTVSFAYYLERRNLQ
jgi:multicomponent Na+:H+ antiporter subunit F